MNERLDSLLRRYEELSEMAQNPDLVKDTKKYKEVMKEYSQLGEIAKANGELRGFLQQYDETKSLIQNESDQAMKDLAKEEMRDLETRIKDAEDRLKFLLIPRDPLDEKDIIMEIRAGTGGEEAGLFVADLFRMYSRFAETKRWKFKIMSSNETELGGFKEFR